MSQPPIIVWFRQDLRLADQPALAAAAESGQPVLPLYILDDDTPGAWKMGGASRWWLAESLTALGRDLARLGSPLLLRRGVAADVLTQVAGEVGASAVYAVAHTEPFWSQAEADTERALAVHDVAFRLFDGRTLIRPGRILTNQGAPYKVFTPFWKALRANGSPRTPQSAPDALRPVDPAPAGDALDDWALRPTKPDWAGGLRETWTAGEAAAADRLAGFLDADLAGYGDGRNRMGCDATSRLSPHLHWGEISPAQIWHAVRHAIDAEASLAKGGEAYLREIGWREFYANVLIDVPTLPDEPMNERFADFAWADDSDGLAAWQQGRTGYPIVDAAMRQLWHMGWMHNRARMIVGSFLIKDLRLPWQLGEAWFWDTLVDADLANNAGGWQWVAGSGTDAAPYFRVFNPVSQGERYDLDGAYVRRWLPELANLPDQVLHKPWQAPPLELEAAGIRLGDTYPEALVDHAQARAHALKAYEKIKGD